MGEQVWLEPFTTYSEQWFIYAYQRGRSMTPGDPRVLRYGMGVTTDSEGRFEFRNVPPGPKIITTQAKWMAGYSQQGGTLSAICHVNDGETTEVIITR